LRDDLSVGRAEQEQPTLSQPQSAATAAARAPSKSRSVPVERKLAGIDVLVGVLWTPRGERWEAAGGGSAGGGVRADDTGGRNTVERRRAEVVGGDVVGGGGRRTGGGQGGGWTGEWIRWKGEGK
jgi:hypothetical protein